VRKELVTFHLDENLIPW